MATSELEILITASNQAKAVIDEVIRGLQDISGELTKATSLKDPDALKKALAGLIAPADDAAKSIKGVGQETKKAEAEVGGFSSTLEGLAEGLIAGAAAFFTFRAAIRFVQQGLREAAQTERLDTALRALGEGAGITEKQLGAAVRGIEAFGASGAGARNAVRGLVQADIDLAGATKLAEAAQRLALSTGQSTDEVLERITFAVQTGNTALLRRAKIIVDQDAAEKALAASLGISVAALTDQQKKQALLNAVVAEGAKLQGIAGEAIGNFSTRLADLPRLTAELAESIGTALLPGFNALVGAVGVFVQNLRQSFTSLIEGSNITAQFAEAMRNAGKGLLSIGNTIGIVLPLIGQLTSSLLTLVNTVVGVIAAGALLIRFVPVWGQVLAVVLLAFELLSEAGFDFGKVIGFIGFILRGFTAAVQIASVLVVSSFRILALDVEVIWTRLMFFIGRRTKQQLAAVVKEVNATQQKIRDDRDALIAGIQISKPDQTAQLEAERDKIKKINVEILESEEEVIAARKAGDAGGVARASFRVQSLQKEKQGIEELIAKTEEQRVGENSLGKARDARAGAGGSAKAEIARLKAVNDAFTSLLQGQGQAAKGVSEEFKNLSATGVKALGELDLALLDTAKRIKEEGDVDLPKVRLAILGAFGQLKTVDDFSKAIEQVGAAIKLGVVGLDNLNAEARFRQAGVALAQVNSELTFFVNAMEQIRSLQETYNTLVTDGVSRQIALKTVQAEIAGDRKKQNALELQAIAVTVVAATNRYEIERQNIQTTTSAKLEAAIRGASNEKALAATSNAIDTEKTQALLKNAKTYYDSLKNSQDAFLAQFRAASLEVKALDQKSADARRSADTDIRELRRKGLTEAQASLDVRREIVEEQDALETAISAKDEKRGEQAIARIRQLAGVVAAGPGDPKANAAQALSILERTRDSEQELIAVQKVAAQERATNAKNAFDALQVQIDTLVTTFQQLAQQQIINLKFQVDETSLTAAVNKVKNAFETMLISVVAAPITGVGAFPEVVPQRAGVNLAGGGRVPGHSPNAKADNILGWLTAGEWVHPVRAVQYWGQDFMRAIDGMKMPKFAGGGPVGHYAEGGPVAGQSGLASAVNRLAATTSGLISANGPFQSESRHPIVLDFGQLGTYQVQGSDRTIESLKRAISQAATKRRRS